MTEPEKLAIIRVLGLLAPPAYFTELYLLPLIGIRMVTLSACATATRRTRPMAM